MERENSIKSVLSLDRLVFDEIEFARKGFQNDHEIHFEIQTVINKKADEEVYRVTLTLDGNKENEYTLKISLTGYFSFEDSGEMPEDRKETLINKNAVAIMMPYLRSEVSLLTAQPETECVVLPAFNINKMLEEGKKE